MNIMQAIRAVFGKVLELPLWTHGLECEICEKTFISAEAHLSHARRQRTIKKHEGKIPLLRRC